MTRYAPVAPRAVWSPSIARLPSLRRALLAAAAVAWTAVWWFYATANGHHRDMTWWAADMADLYAGRLAADGFYGYSPAFVQLLALRALPWEAAAWAWGGLMLAALVVCAGRWTPLVILAPPVLGELIIGNVHLLYAGAIVLGFRWPQTWALMLLTKVTPGIGLLWFAARREWRKLGIALGATAAITLVSFAIAPELWPEWLATLTASAQAQPLPVQPNALFPVPLLVRLPLAAAIVVWGALTDRRWTVALAVVLALPVVWTAGLAVLVAAIPYVGRRGAADERSQPTSSAG
jgi:hypothetical protein